jgi:hypothetical protein
MPFLENNIYSTDAKLINIGHSKTTHSIYTSSPFECVEYSFAGSTIYYYKEDKLWNMEYLLT